MLVTPLGNGTTSGDAPTFTGVKLSGLTASRVVLTDADKNLVSESAGFTVVGNITAQGTGSHVFGTTNRVTMAAGALAATGTVKATSANLYPITLGATAADNGAGLISDGNVALQLPNVGSAGFYLQNYARNSNLLVVASTGAATFGSSVTTSAPTGGTAGAWKFGIRVAATTTLDTTQYLQLDIGGTLYKVAVVTS